MVAGGVRTASALPAMPKKELKSLQKALRAENKAAAKAAKKAPKHIEADEQPVAQPVIEEPEPSEPVGVAYDTSGTTDWGTPWFEDAREAALAD